MNTKDLLEGFAWQLHNAGIGIYRPTGVYTASEIGIVHKITPTAPDRCIILNSYRPQHR